MLYFMYNIGAVFALMKHSSVCQEMVRDLLLDLPVLSSPIILLCMNKELRNQCVLLLQRNPTGHYMEGTKKKSERQTSSSKNLRRRWHNSPQTAKLVMCKKWHFYICSQIICSDCIHPLDYPLIQLTFGLCLTDGCTVTPSGDLRDCIHFNTGGFRSQIAGANTSENPLCSLIFFFTHTNFARVSSSCRGCSTIKCRNGH